MIKVMIVDDEPYIRQGLRILIGWEQYGFEVCAEAANGKEAIELLKQKKIDLIVTDIKMPEMNGVELIEHTWEHVSKQIRFIILSGFYEFEYAKKAIKYGVVDYVLKPVQKEELIKVLESYKEQYFAYYDEIDEKINSSSLLAHKERMDELVKAIEENDKEAISRIIDKVYYLFKELSREPHIIKITLDYLVFNLISLAMDLDPDFNQEDIYRIINQAGYEQITVKGSLKQFKDFAVDFAAYLIRLRNSAFSGVICQIEKEITENYKDNLSLRSLSEKYYINSAYLGQMFKKHYGSSFKDYLNNYRIDRAAELLLRSDAKIYLVAEAVGFNNTDYFISKFVQLKGITPHQYRKQYMLRE